MESRASSSSQSQQPIQEIRRVSSSTPIITVHEPINEIERSLCCKLFRCLSTIIFSLHLCLVAILVIFLTVLGLQSAHFHPKKWYPPLLASILSAGIIAFSIQAFTACSPSKAFKSAFWFTPVLSVASGVFFVILGSPGGLAVGVILLVSSFLMMLHVRWANRRLNYGVEILTVSTNYPPPNTPIFVVGSLLVGIVYATFAVVGIGGAIAVTSGFKVLFVGVILLSLTWTMQVIKNIVQVTVSRIKYLNLAWGREKNLRAAIRETVRCLFGTICLGSAMNPIICFVGGLARLLNLLAGDSDEFLFSCANCFTEIGLMMGSHGNRWGFVHVGVHNKGIVQASFDTWKAFRRADLESVIESDLTVTFCILCGISSGAICSILSGIWAIVIYKSYATELAIYSFMIGYFLCRIGTAWMQACVSAYYVAYADNPMNPRFDSTVIQQIRDLQQRLQASSST